MATPSELSDAAVEAGVNPSAVLKWANDPEVLRNPEYQVMPAAQMVKRFQQGSMALQQAQSGKIDLNALTKGTLPPVTVTEKRPNIPSTVNPYAGTTQEKAAGEGGNPNASSLSQFDPAALQAAQAKYDQNYKDQAVGRGLTGLLAGFGGGTAGVTADRQGWAEKNKEIYDQTVGAQKRLQEQATAAQAAVTSAQNREESAGKFEGTQREQQQKLDIGNFTVQQQRDLNDPNSPQTMLAKALIADQLKAAGMSSPAIDKLVKSNTVTAQQLMGFMDPKVLEAYKTKVGIGKTIADTEKVQIENKFGKAGAGTHIIPKEEQLKADIETLRMLKSEYDKEPDDSPDKAGLFREIIRVEQRIKQPTETLRQGAGGTTQTTVSAGPVTISPSPGAQTESTGAGVDRVKSAEQFKNYNAIVKPDIDKTLGLLNKTYTGKGAAAMAAILPDSDQAEVASRLAALNNTYPDALPPEIAANLKSQASKPGFNGTFQLGLSAAQSIKLLNEAKQRVERLEAYRTAQSKYEDKGGRPSEFHQTPASKRATAPPRMITFTKGNRTLNVPESATEDIKQIEADGFKRK